MKRLLDYDPEAGITQWHDFDEMSGTTIIRTEQDVEPIIEDNKRRANEATGPMGDNVHAATIPVGVQLEWMTKYGIDAFDPNHWEGVKRLLNSNEYRYLKVRHIII